MRSRSLYLQEAGSLLKLTAPLVLGQLSQTAMGFVDTVMAGRYSAVDLAAVAVGSSIFFPVFLFMIGLLAAVTPLVAQAHGSGNPEAARHAIRQGMVIGLLIGLALMPLLWLMTPVMIWMGISAEVIPITREYLFAVSWGLPLVGIFLALRNGGDGFAKPRLSMYTGFFGLLVNIIANYLLIYGKLGLPALGGAGCGWATSLSLLAMLLFMAFLLKKSRIRGTERLFAPPTRSKGASTASFFRLGLPIGLALFIECSIFALIALFIAKLGAEVVAAHQIALNFTSLLYMLPYSLSIALTVRVGYTIGAARTDQLRRTMATGLGLALAGAMLTCLLILGFSAEIAALYSPDPGVQQLAAALLCLAAIFQLPDAMQTNCAGILRGCKDTRVPLLLMLFAYWGIGLPLGYGLGLAGLGGLEPGPHGFWIGLICALATAATLLGLRVLIMLRRLEQMISGSGSESPSSSQG
ncbi:MATE family efflux transporter [Desulfobulbus alkaliphilus]|uniref:MATE family efflux transporter n=1 Tax=Desulfobulbus alkaliphilus TaxID=869814 RepID=UPI001963D350|nr:MATE family efflux transporter [Desulfobulbus alkaliphilus]MBM9536792.1 MATE family efflux transporter [Desulfobulbus alkaliphilus]